MGLPTVKRSLGQFRQPGTMVEKFGVIPAQALLLTAAEYLLCGGIQKNGAAIAVEQQDPGAQAVQDELRLCAHKLLSNTALSC